MKNNAFDYPRDYGWRRITPVERAQMLLWIDGFIPKNEVEERDKIILQYFVRDNLSAQAIVKKRHPKIVCFSNRNKGRPLSTTSVLRCIYKYFPNLENRKTSQKENKRVEHIRQREKDNSPHVYQCAFCGDTKALEEHHMIPLFMGGTNDNENLVFLCSSCHKRVTRYQRRFMKNGSTQCSTFRVK